MAVIIARPQSARRVWWRRGAAAILVLVMLVIVWNWSRWSAAAAVGAAYGARIGCACRYVEGRPEESCKGDTRGQPGMGLVSVSDDPDSRAVTGHVWLMARRTARFRPGFGCVLDPA